MNISTLTLAAAMLASLGISSASAQTSMSLAGTWRLSTADTTAIVELPGTLDTNGIGTPNRDMAETTQLARKRTYTGPAEYTRTVTIPRDWKGKNITLTMGRTRPTTVYVDGKQAGSSRLISASHTYDLTRWLTPGKHQLKIVVDNGDAIPIQIRESSHACTESTQTNWNGIVGDITLTAASPTRITDAQVYPVMSPRGFRVSVSVANPIAGQVLAVQSGTAVASTRLRRGVDHYDLNLELGDTARTWSHRSPALHDLTISIAGHDMRRLRAGLRDFRTQGRHILVNDTLTFLRGRHDACVFPLTGFAPMDTAAWRQYFRTVREYGLNHVRFHSWCPPEAAFAAADIEGIYLQPELPIWGTFNEAETDLMDVLHADGMAIMKQYSNHPSFVMFSLGNELWGEVPLMKKFNDDFRAVDHRHIYANGSNAFLGYQGSTDGEEFLVTCRVGAGDGYEGYSSHTRASFSFADAYDGGILNHNYPNTTDNFEHAAQASPVPVLGHETGQYQIYPQYSELAKYTGVTEPRNYQVFRDRLADANMAGQADDFFKASGAWSAELYRADVEMNLRTPSMAGFQLLDLQDYPGQGTAVVGLLDPFMDSKGLIDPATWRNSCSDLVLLGMLPRRTYQGGDTLRAAIGAANYTGKPLRGKMYWSINDPEGEILDYGMVDSPALHGFTQAGEVAVELPRVDKPGKYTFKLEVPTSKATNSYDIWIYPRSAAKPQAAKDIIVTDDINHALSSLRRGNKVLLMPRSADVDSATVGGLFTTDYWNYRMFRTICENNDKPVSPGTLGLLINERHPALSLFPTENHTNWQWYTAAHNSRPLILDRLNGIDYRPIVQVIDNVERNHRLGLVMEFEVDNGKLMLLMADKEAMEAQPEGRQLVQSLLQYMDSDNFKPATRLAPDFVRDLLTTAPNATDVRQLHNISYD